MRLPPVELLTDEYEFAMAESYVSQGIAGDRVAFELFVRELPPDRGYLLAAGLERAVEYLTGLRFSDEALAHLERTGTCSARTCDALRQATFTGDVDAVPEGTVVFAGEPLMRVEGPRMVCQIAESLLLNQLAFQAAVATKAARIVQAAAGRQVVDFGFRRAHGADAGLLAARSAWIAGFAGTATVAASYLWGIPAVGTMAHSYVLAFASEVEAFRAFLRDHPGRSTLLIDTNETLGGARAAVAAARAEGVVPQAVRLDSGDLAQGSRDVRRILDEGGLDETRIVVSGDLDEYRIDELVRGGAPVDGFGAGTRLVTSEDAPALSAVYKLVESAGRPVMKRGGAKASLPGRHQVLRNLPDPDLIALADEPADSARPLLEPVLRSGELVQPLPSLDEIRRRAAAGLDELPPAVRALRNPDTLRPRLSPKLVALKETLA